MSWFGLGKLFGTKSARRADLGEVAPIRARYAAAEDDPEMAAHWGHTDALDADAANSLGVRKRLRERFRLERANNGYAVGMVRTDRDYIVGTGPKLRMQTTSPAFNAMVESRWQQWCQASKLNRKLRTMRLAKTSDGEAFALLTHNQRLADLVKLDLRLIECDQITTPYLPYGEAGRVDGVWFDEDGNPTAYDMLPYHPGGLVWPVANVDPIRVPAQFMLHWFSEERSGQHRGVPDCSATTNLFGGTRRFRAAVLSSAESVANVPFVMEMGAGNEGPDEVRPFSTMPVEKNMFIMTPSGAKLASPRAEQPTTTYPEYNRATVAESGRPLAMSYSTAACDSSQSSFSGARMDNMPFYMAAKVERDDAELLVLNPLFEAWFAEAVPAYGWNQPTGPAPEHGWDWPPMPTIDDEKAANARKTDLSTGATSMTAVYAEQGKDFEDELAVMAKDYGVKIDEMRQKLLESNLQKAGGQPGAPTSTIQEPAPTPINRMASYAGNGNGKSRSPA